jgi:NAD(P)H dehydrogenase (quinone)
MRALWLLAHPRSDSLNAHLCRVGIAFLQAQGWRVEQSDLYRQGWDAVLVE